MSGGQKTHKHKVNNSSTTQFFLLVVLYTNQLMPYETQITQKNY